jgi:hypothetical protein
MKSWQVLLNKTPNKGGKEEQRENPSLSQKHKNPNESQRGKGTNYVPKPSLVARSISKKEREAKPKKLGSLKECSPTTMTHLKIEATCALYKTTY